MPRPAPAAEPTSGPLRDLDTVEGPAPQSLEPDPQHEVQDYFHAEKRAAGILVAVAIGALGAGVVLWTLDHPLRYMAYPLAFIAILQLIGGGIVYGRTQDQLRLILTRLASDDPDIRRLEATRMRTVLRKLRMMKIAEAAIIVTGIGLLFTDDVPMKAIGLGLVLQGLFLLGFDAAAARRGRLYMQSLTTPWIRE